MKALVIVGSPKRKGQTMQMVTHFTSHLNADVEIVNVFDYKPIHPCMDCRQCETKDFCTQNDYFNEILDKIENSDCIILASPMWFGNVSGTLLSFLSRLQILVNGYEKRKDKIHKWNKIAFLLMSSGAKWNSMAKSVEATIEFYTKAMDALMLDSIYANKTDDLAAGENEYVLQKCEYAAKLANQWYQDKKSGKSYRYGYSSSNYMDGLDK